MAVNNSVERPVVPVVDLRDWRDELSSARFARAFGEALREFGFVRVRGHNLAPELVDGAYDSCRALFALPTSSKKSYVLGGAAGQRGYTPFRVESAKDRDLPDLKEFWHVGRALPTDHPMRDVYPDNVWPEELPAFKPTVGALFACLDQCATQLLDALAFYLDVSPETFSGITTDGDTVLRLLHYPPLDDNTIVPGALRAAAHEDINLLTLLVASTDPGLEVQLSDGSWLAVNPEPGEIIVDSGDIMARITDGYLPATTHRVTNPDDGQAERYSLPFFVHPRPDALLRVIPQYRDASRITPTEDILAGTFLLQRLTALGLS